MPVAMTLTDKIVAGAAPVALSQFFTVSAPPAGQANPAYLVRYRPSTVTPMPPVRGAWPAPSPVMAPA